jgi:hypothetical protein
MFVLVLTATGVTFLTEILNHLKQCSRYIYTFEENFVSNILTANSEMKQKRAFCVEKTSIFAMSR